MLEKGKSWFLLLQEMLRNGYKYNWSIQGSLHDWLLGEMAKYDKSHASCKSPTHRRVVVLTAKSCRFKFES